MKFVDSFLSKFKKVDESDKDRLRTSRSHLTPETSDIVASSPSTPIGVENTSLGSIKSRSGPSKSITRLRAFVKKKSVEELSAEDAQRQQAREEFTSNALNDMGNEV